MKKIVVCIAAGLCASQFAIADLMMASLGGTYSQTFDTLANTGTGNAWTDNSTLNGWYAEDATYNADAGSSTAGAMYSYGSASSTDRALGGIGSSGNANTTVGFILQNDTGVSITDLALGFTGEQWRRGANATQRSETMTFSYRIDTVANLVSAFDAGTSFTAFSSLNFTSPNATLTTGTALDGNASGNFTTLSLTSLGVTLADGQAIAFRWNDPNDAGTDHGMSIDNVSATWTVVPEPTTAALMGLAAVLLYRRRFA